MRDAVVYMKCAGFVVSLLWGVPWLYPHYGCSSALPSLRVSLKPQHVGPPDATGAYQFEALSEEHIPSVNALYADNQAHMIGSEVRSDDWWEWQPRHPHADYEVARDETGAVAGYYQAIAPADGLMVFDVGIRDRAAGEEVPGRLRSMAAERELERFDLNTSPVLAFAHICFARNGELRVSRGGGAGMIRVLDLPALLAVLEPEFARRLAHSEWGATRDGGVDYTLRLISDEGAAAVRLSGGCVHVEDERTEADDESYIPLAVLNPFVTGFQPRSELAGSASGDPEQ
jgi:hypothetical protein